MMENIDSIFFYDKFELVKVVGKKIGFNNGITQTIKNLIKNKMPEEDIIKFVQYPKKNWMKLRRVWVNKAHTFLYNTHFNFILTLIFNI